MSQREYGDFVDDIVNACRSLINFVKGITIDNYIDDEKTRYAVERGFQIMGEAVKHLPEELKMEKSANTMVNNDGFAQSHSPWLFQP